MVFRDLRVIGMSCREEEGNVMSVLLKKLLNLGIVQLSRA